MKRKPNTKCEICGKPQYRRPSDIKKAKHICCKGCRSELYKKFKNYYGEGLKKGRGWNKGMSKANGDVLNYGRPRSAITKERISKSLKGKERVERIKKTCLKCNNIFYVIPSNNKQKFCSLKCANIFLNKNRVYPTGKDNQNWKGGIGKKVCEWCGNIYEVMHSKINIQKYCSLDCKHKAHSRFMVENPPFIQMYDTDIEIILKNWLDKNKIKYIAQHPIEGLTISDFFIEPNICLYADGDYWHNLEKVKKRDIWINRQLTKKGYKIIRLWGSQIKKGVRPDEILQKG